MPSGNSVPGVARSRGTAPVEILEREAKYQDVPKVLLEEHYEYLGSDDIAIDRYIDPAYARLENERLWPKVWQMACRLEEIPQVGDHIVYEVANYSIIVVRVDEDSIKAFYNSCLHRGTALRSEDGCVPYFRCPFHGWTWNLDGSVKVLTAEWDLPHVTKSDFCLPECLVGMWGGFVFINMDLDAAPLEEYLGVLPSHFEAWPLERRFKAAHVAKVLPCNWKVAMEAFIEVYHVASTHPQLLAYIGDENTQYDVYGDHISRFVNPFGTLSPIVPIESDETEIARAYARDFKIGDPDTITVPEGSTARQVIADAMRTQLSSVLGADLLSLPNCDAIDSIEYFVFPNFLPWPGIGIPIVYRFLPVSDDPNECLMEIMLLAPLPPGVDWVPPAKMHLLGPDESWDKAPEIGLLGMTTNQDMVNIPLIQKGLRTSKKGTITLADYQEIRIRHFHRTLDKYMAG